eukprot:1632841-Rhodomonas_salina.1
MKYSTRSQKLPPPPQNFAPGRGSELADSAMRYAVQIGRMVAMCGTELAYAAMRCTVLRWRMVLRGVRPRLGGGRTAAYRPTRVRLLWYRPTPVLRAVRYCHSRYQATLWLVLSARMLLPEGYPGELLVVGGSEPGLSAT